MMTGLGLFFRRAGQGLLLALLFLPGCVSQQTGDGRNSRAAKSFYQGLQRSDITMARISLQTALEKQRSGRLFEWGGSDSQVKGIIIIRRTFKDQSNRYCREFREILLPIAGETRERQRIACRTAREKWTLVRS